MKSDEKRIENCKKIRELQDENMLLAFGLDTFENRALKTEKDEFRNLFTDFTNNFFNLWGHKVKKDGSLKEKPNVIHDPADIIEIIKVEG